MGFWQRETEYQETCSLGVNLRTVGPCQCPGCQFFGINHATYRVGESFGVRLDYSDVELQAPGFSRGVTDLCYNDRRQDWGVPSHAMPA